MWGQVPTHILCLRPAPVQVSAWKFFHHATCLMRHMLTVTPAAAVGGNAVHAQVPSAPGVQCCACTINMPDHQAQPMAAADIGRC